jgi:hypothetical protein
MFVSLISPSPFRAAGFSKDGAGANLNLRRDFIARAIAEAVSCIYNTPQSPLKLHDPRYGVVGRGAAVSLVPIVCAQIDGRGSAAALEPRSI